MNCTHFSHFVHCFLVSVVVFIHATRCSATQYRLVNSAGDSFLDQDSFYVDKKFSFHLDHTSGSDHFEIRESLNTAAFPVRLTGGVRLVTGDANQEDQLVLLVRASSPTKSALDCVFTYNGTHGVYVESAREWAPPPDASDLQLNIDIILFVRPHTLQFRHTDVSTENLDIDISQDLWFETYRMNLVAGRGSITGIESLRFTAHSIAIKTTRGSISGNWSLPGSISFETDSGDIDVGLVPKRWSAGPNTHGDLAALSNSGNIDIRMPLEKDQLSLRNGTTRVEAREGSITGTFVHGAITYLEAYESVTATLLPYSAFYEWGKIQHNFITTKCSHGNTTIEVLPPVIDTYYGVNPLFLTTSLHKQGTGAPRSSPDSSMKLEYPGEWAGIAVGRAEAGGAVSVMGEDFEELERNESTVKVQRTWKPLASHLLFEAGSGHAELRLNPCSAWECAFPPTDVMAP